MIVIDILLAVFVVGVVCWGARLAYTELRATLGERGNRIF